MHDWIKQGGGRCNRGLSEVYSVILCLKGHIWSQEEGVSGTKHFYWFHCMELGHFTL